jgi:hypothetical protein
LQVEQQTLVSANGTTGFSADAFLARFDTTGHKEMLQPLGEGGDEFAHAFHISPGPTFYLGGSFDSKQLTANQQSVANPEQKTIGFFLQGK